MKSLFSYLLIFLFISCGISNKNEKNDSLKDKGIHYINKKHWDKAISIFLNLIKENNSLEHRYLLALSYAGCSRYSLLNFHDKLNDHIQEYKVVEDNFLEEFMRISNKFPELSNKERNCLDKAVEYFPIDEAEILLSSSKKYNFDWATLRLYRLVYNLKESYHYFNKKLIEEEGKNITVLELLQQNQNLTKKILDDAFMFYIYLDNSYDKLDKYAKEVVDLAKYLLEKNNLNISVNSNALNFENFLKDLFNQNPELIDFFSINFIKMFNVLSEENIALVLSFIANPDNKDLLKEIFEVKPEIQDYSNNLKSILEDFPSSEYINIMLNSKVYSINEVLNKSEDLNFNDFSYPNTEEFSSQQ